MICRLSAQPKFWKLAETAPSEILKWFCLVKAVCITALHANNSFWLEYMYFGHASAPMHICMFCSMTKVYTILQSKTVFARTNLAIWICFAFSDTGPWPWPWDKVGLEFKCCGSFALLWYFLGQTACTQQIWWSMLIWHFTGDGLLLGGFWIPAEIIQEHHESISMVSTMYISYKMYLS